jgi:putative transposase
MTPPKEYRRKLPHIQPENGVFFITFRLADSIPKKVLDALHSNCQQVIESRENTQKEINLAQQEYFDTVEELIDKASDGPRGSTILKLLKKLPKVCIFMMAKIII